MKVWDSNCNNIFLPLILNNIGSSSNSRILYIFYWRFAVAISTSEVASHHPFYISSILSTFTFSWHWTYTLELLKDAEIIIFSVQILLKMYQGLVIGVCRVLAHAYFYWRRYDFGQACVGISTHNFLIIRTNCERKNDRYYFTI